MLRLSAYCARWFLVLGDWAIDDRLCDPREFGRSRSGSSDISPSGLTAVTTLDALAFLIAFVISYGVNRFERRQKTKS